jgi:hypothetical protein
MDDATNTQAAPEGAARDTDTNGTRRLGGRQRVTYAEAGAAARQAIRRATRAKLSGSDWRVLGRVLALTATYSKLTDDVYVAEVAAETLGASEDAYRRTLAILRKLRAEGIIEFEGSRGRGKRSRIGLPAVQEKGGESYPLLLEEEGVGSHPKKGVESDPPTEKGSEKSTGAPYPHDLTELVAGLRLTPDQLTLLSTIPLPQLRTKLTELRSNTRVRSVRAVLLTWARERGGVTTLGPEARARQARSWFANEGVLLEAHGFDEELTRRTEDGLPSEVADELRQAYHERREAA